MGYNEGAKQGPTIRGEEADKVTLEGLLKRGRFLRVNIFLRSGPQAYPQTAKAA